METTVIIFLVVILLLFYYWYRRPSKLPPGPRGIPILGYAPFAGKQQERTAYQLSKIYGPIMSIRFGSEDWLFLNDYESIHQALVKQPTIFSGRPPPIIEEAFSAPGLITHDYDENWKSQRKFGLKTLRSYGFGKKSMEDFCLEELSCVLKAIGHENGKPFDISDLLHSAISNNICSILLGKRFDYDDKEFQHIIHSIINSFDDPKMSTTLRIIILMPKLRNVPPFSTNIKSFFETNFNPIHNWMMKFVNEHEETFDENNLRDFIDTFLVEMKKGNDPTFTKDQLIQYIHDLFAGGTETTASTLLWSLLCLLHYPESQDKLRREIFDVIGPSGEVTTANKAEMPYTNAFMQEVFRYRTLAPLNVTHKTTAKAELNGYIIPKDTKVAPNIWAVHNDTQYWKEPEKFIPERFLDEEGNFVRSDHVIPFSVGPRHCVAEQLARMEFFLFLVGMIQKFEFVPDPTADNLPDIENGADGFVFVPKRFKFVAKEL